MSKKSNHPILTLVAGCGALLAVQRDRCSESNLRAASPRGDALLPCSMSLTEEVANPIASPMAASVIPAARSSEMRDDHVTMRPTLRHPVTETQRHPVTVFRQNGRMAKNAYGQRFLTLGDRVTHWRKKRGMKRRELADKAGLPYSSLSEIEQNRQEKSAHTPMIAKALRINAVYLSTDEGDPEDLSVPMPEPSSWPLSFDVERFLALNDIERELAEVQFLRAIEKIESQKAKRPSARRAS